MFGDDKEPEDSDLTLAKATLRLALQKGEHADAVELVEAIIDVKLAIFMEEAAMRLSARQRGRE